MKTKKRTIMGKKYEKLVTEDVEDTDCFFEAFAEFDVLKSPLLVSKLNVKQEEVLVNTEEGFKQMEKQRKKVVYQSPGDIRRKHGISERDQAERLCVHRILQMYFFNKRLDESFLGCA